MVHDYILTVTALTRACEAVSIVLWCKVLQGASAQRQLGGIPCTLTGQQLAPAEEQPGHQPHWSGEDKDQEKQPY